MKLLRFVARERAVIAGVLVGLGDVIATLAKDDNLSWHSALPVLAGFVARFFVTPTSKENPA